MTPLLRTPQGLNEVGVGYDDRDIGGPSAGVKEER
jgi:hypothetical protein